MGGWVGWGGWVVGSNENIAISAPMGLQAGAWAELGKISKQAGAEGIGIGLLRLICFHTKRRNLKFNVLQLVFAKLSPSPSLKPQLG